MKKINNLKNKMVISVLFCAFAFIACTAQDQNIIKLSPPNKDGGIPLMKALNERQSDRNFIDKTLTGQQLSDMLWAGYGVNRPDKKKRTAPSAHDKQEIDIYVTMANGIFLYDAFNHSLIEISKNDIRSKTGSQGFVGTAAINLIYVMDRKKAKSDDENQSIAWASVTAGAIVQNIYLYCASENLGCVVRGWVDPEVMKTELKLNNEQVVILAQTVGYTKK